MSEKIKINSSTNIITDAITGPRPSKKTSVRFVSAPRTPDNDAGMSEYDHCCKYIAWAREIPILADFLVKNLVEGKRSYSFVNYLKKMGFRAGLPDYHLPVGNGKYIGLWLEMKRPELRGKNNPNVVQDEWLSKLNGIGHCAMYVYGYEDAINVTKAYLANKL